MKQIIAGVYARVSTTDQHTENQLPEMHRCAERYQWPVVEYLEEASGKEGGKRPVLDMLLEDVRAGRINVVIVWRIDRFGRSVKDFIRNVEILNESHCRFMSATEPIDTDEHSPFGKMIMMLLMIFAEFERDTIIQRVRSGMKRCLRDVAAGIPRKSRSGWDLAPGRPKKIRPHGRAFDMWKQGMGIRAIGRELGIPESSVRRAIRKLSEV